MKIGIEVQRLFRKNKFGIETSSLELIKNLREVDRDNEYVIFAKNDGDRACLEATDNLKIKTLGGRIFADFEQFFLPIAARNEHVDILHCTGNTAPYFCPVPIVQTLHDVIFMDPIPENDTFYQRFGNLYRRKIVPLVTPRSKLVITVSKYEKERIVSRLGIDPEKVHVVYNGMNEKHFHTNNDLGRQQAIKAKYNLPDNFILFLGNPSHRKNPTGVIEGYVKYASQCKNPLPLVTPGLPKKFVSATLAGLSCAYDRKRFISPGYIDDADLPLIYAASKLFLFPSLSEGFGMPVIEAMACGTPVITSKASAMPEIAGNAALLVDPHSASEIAESILALSNNETLRNKKIHDGLLNAKRFNWTHTAQNVIGLYNTAFQQVKSSKRASSFVQKQVYATRD